MPKIIYHQPDGAVREIDVPVGSSVMLGAIQNDVSGILAECGGSCSCATCHVYVDEAFMAKMPPAEEIEQEMLTAVASERKPTSRLSCQIEITPELDGLIVHIPEEQY